MGRTTTFLAAALLAASLGAGAGTPAFAGGHTNPVDRVSNPGALDFPDVQVRLPDLNAPFVRDGVVTEPHRFAAIVPGLPQADVSAALGQPHRRQGGQWGYDFKFAMPQSQSYLVCQYKVVFDEHQNVSDTAWRRRQCQQLTSGEPPAAGEQAAGLE